MTYLPGCAPGARGRKPCEILEKSCFCEKCEKCEKSSGKQALERPDLCREASKLENHAAAVALTYFAYNFIKIHRTLRMTPAMAACVTDRLQYERRAERAA